MIKIKPVEEPYEEADGMRVLVERRLPDGVEVGREAIHRWLEDLAPAEEWGTMFGHSEEQWETFHARYLDELRKGRRADIVADLARRARRGAVTLLFHAHDFERNHAAVIRDEIARLLASE